MKPNYASAMGICGSNDYLQMGVNRAFQSAMIFREGDVPILRVSIFYCILLEFV